MTGHGAGHAVLRPRLHPPALDVEHPDGVGGGHVRRLRGVGTRRRVHRGRFGGRRDGGPEAAQGEYLRRRAHPCRPHRGDVAESAERRSRPEHASGRHGHRLSRRRAGRPDPRARREQCAHGGAPARPRSALSVPPRAHRLDGRAGGPLRHPPRPHRGGPQGRPRGGAARHHRGRRGARLPRAQARAAGRLVPARCPQHAARALHAERHRRFPDGRGGPQRPHPLRRRRHPRLQSARRGGGRGPRHRAHGEAGGQGGHPSRSCSPTPRCAARRRRGRLRSPSARSRPTMPG